MKILSFGEILFDIFDGSEKLGGAPLNFCSDMVKMGAKGYMLSALGSDRLGSNAIAAMENIGIDYSLSNTESLFGTGSCIVSTDENGDASYELVEGVAYDHITVSDEDVARINAEGFDVFYFGTLAQRNISSRATLDKIFASCSFDNVFFDVNIRNMYYSDEIIRTGLERATILKLNYSECGLLCDMGFCMTRFGEKDDDVTLRSIAHELCETYNIETVIITLDKDGACAYRYSSDEYFRSDKATGEVISTVGAGDAFSACFIYNYVNGEPLSACVERANILGDYTVGYLEAIPPYTEELLNKIKGTDK